MQSEIDVGASCLEPKYKRALREAARRIKRGQVVIAETLIRSVALNSREGSLKFRSIPISRLGIYVPGGSAPLASSLLMAAIPAQLAGVKEIAVCTPPKRDGSIDPAILFAAKLCSISEIYRIGGAQAIAAMAYGIGMRKVDMIAGPGNKFVASAKALVASRNLVKIDLFAGPSEVLVIADDSAMPEYVAADMLAQAEHGADSKAICITASRKFAKQLESELNAQLKQRKRQAILGRSIKAGSKIIVVNSLDAAIKLANEIAPEHLEIFCRNAQQIAGEIRNAGAIFIKTGEAFGDYGMGGGNHILPTGGAARFSSGVSPLSFVKWIYEERFSERAQKKLATTAGLIGDIEGLDGHAEAARIRGRK